MVMYAYLVSFICIVSGAVAAQDIQTTIPESLQKYAQNNLKTTTLVEALLKNNTRRINSVADDVYDDINGRGKLTVTDMANFINKTAKELRGINKKKDEPLEDFPLPTNDMINEAAAQGMLSIAGDVNATVSEPQFKEYMQGMVNVSFSYAPEICYAVQMEQLKCELLSANNPELKKPYKEIKARMDAVVGMCRSGLTALSNYRLEACQMDIASQVPTTANVTTLENSCKKQFACYLMPKEAKQNKWNLTAGEEAKVVPMAATPPSPKQMADQAILNDFCERALRKQARAQAWKRFGVGLGVGIGAIALLLLTPGIGEAALVGAGGFFGSVFVIFILWFFTFFIASTISDMLISPSSVSIPKTQSDTLGDLKVIAN
ncbi:hypothetical protein MIR68_007591 [Amoeboaphelidium protococcarum]|nr:hypothetical protein MIR68_007591 [Amoeboaphelidium protococcarum]